MASYSNITQPKQIQQGFTESDYKKLVKEMNSSLDTHVKANYLNYVKGNKKKGIKGQLAIKGFPKDLNPNKFNENLPLKQSKVRAFQKFVIQRRKGEGFDSKVDNSKAINFSKYDGDIMITNTINKQFNESNGYKVVPTVPNEVAEYRVKKTGESVVSGVPVETFTMYIDVTGIVNANKPMSGAGINNGNAYHFTKTISDAVRKAFGSGGKHDPKIYNGYSGIFSMGKDAGKKGNPLYKKSGSLTGQQAGSEEFKQICKKNK